MAPNYQENFDHLVDEFEKDAQGDPSDPLRRHDAEKEASKYISKLLRRYADRIDHGELVLGYESYDNEIVSEITVLLSKRWPG